MVPFPASLILLPATVALGVAYLWVERRPRARTSARMGILAAVCALPFFTRGPGPAQVILGLCVGYLGLRMVALSRRCQRMDLQRTVLALIHLEPLFDPRPAPWPRPGWLIMRGLVQIAACIALLWMGASLRWWSVGLGGRLLDDMLVFAEVAIGAEGLHLTVVGCSAWAGHHVHGLLNQPFRATSLSDFWARRWNRLVQRHLDEGFFRPFLRAGHPRLGLLAAFFASGILHLLVLADAGPPAAQVWAGAQVLGFFLLHGALVAIERRLGWHKEPSLPGPRLIARVRSLTLFVLLSPLLLDPFADIAHVHGRRLGPPEQALVERLEERPGGLAAIHARAGVAPAIGKVVPLGMHAEDHR